MADYEDTEPGDYTGATECQLRLPIAHESQSTTLHLTNGGLHVEGERKGFGLSASISLAPCRG
jgi:hypothetical protein